MGEGRIDGFWAGDWCWAMGEGEGEEEGEGIVFKCNRNRKGNGKMKNVNMKGITTYKQHKHTLISNESKDLVMF